MERTYVVKFEQGRTVLKSGYAVLGGLDDDGSLLDESPRIIAEEAAMLLRTGGVLEATPCCQDKSRRHISGDEAHDVIWTLKVTGFSTAFLYEWE